MSSFPTQTEEECAAGLKPWHPQAGSTQLPGAPAPLAYQVKRISGLFPIVLAASFSNLSFASEPAMAVAQGMGHTTRSSSNDGGAAYTAPATIWLSSSFDVSGGARIGTGKSRLYQASAQDSQTGPVGLGVQWFRQDEDTTPSRAELPGWKRPGENFENPTSTSVFSAALGGGGVHHLFSIAAGLRYYTRTAPVTGTQSEINGVVSMGGIVQDQLTLTLTAENLIPQDGFDGAPLSLGTGTRWQPTERFALAFDSLSDFESKDEGIAFTSMAGMEYRVGEVVPVRLGWMNDGVTGQGYATAGLGVSNETAGLNYGGRLEVGEGAGDSPGHWHGLSLRASF